MADLSQQKWSEQLENDDNAVILDVRSEGEMEEGHIEGAILMDIHQSARFMEKAKEMDPSKNYYIYCHSGARSGQACAIFNSIGIKNAYNLMGGIMLWNGKITR